MTHYLTKSSFQVGHRCTKRLWHEHQKLWVREKTANDEKNSHEGERFNDYVREYFPGGELVGWNAGPIDKAAERTKQLLSQDSVIIFEAAFVYDQLLCFADVVIKEQGSIRLIEAKSSNAPKVTNKDDFEHVYDAAFQVYVMTQCGFRPEAIEIMHSNADCIWPDKDNLFSFLDITEEAFARLGEVEIISEQLVKVIESSTSPDVTIGAFCKKPKGQECPHIKLCWQKPTENTIYDLPRITESKLNKLEAIGAHTIEQVPHDADLTATQRRLVDVIQNQVENVDSERLKLELGKLAYPLHFFDFETYNPSVPLWDNSRPWQQVPFQYSLHRLDADGTLAHFEYLSETKEDPRPALIEAMQQHFEQQGSIVVYFAPFERGRLEELARDFPEHEAFLLSLVERLWDQYEVFKHCFEDHRLALSKSIKVVLPTFVPDMSYESLAVQKGDQAQLEWRNMIELPEGNTKQRKVNELKEYCKLDTLAMVKLHEFLISI